MSDDTDPNIGEISAVGIPVTDQDAALAVYSEVLGFELRVDMPLPQLGSRWIMLAPRGATATIALVVASDDAPAGVETGIRFHADDAAATHQALRARGVEVGDLLRWPGAPPMFQVHDPDGNRFEIIE